MSCVGLTALCKLDQRGAKLFRLGGPELCGPPLQIANTNERVGVQLAAQGSNAGCRFCIHPRQRLAGE